MVELHPGNVLDAVPHARGALPPGGIRQAIGINDGQDITGIFRNAPVPGRAWHQRSFRKKLHTGIGPA
jgi:hypothetical protein